jgi:hypothetical protein
VGEGSRRGGVLQVNEARTREILLSQQLHLGSSIGAYLLIIRGRLGYIVHQDRQQFLYSMDARRICTILSRAVYGLSGALGKLSPLAGYRVYNVEYAKFVGSRGLLEVCV